MKLCGFIRPTNLAEAHQKLRELGAEGMALAGGTALHFLSENKQHIAVDITNLGLSYIRPEADNYVIGATTPLAEIQRYRAPGFAMHEICRRISTHQIRNVSTIGGNICRVFPWADMPVVLLAMNGRMVIYSGNETEVGADQFFASQPSHRFANGELLTAVKIPVLHAHQGFGSVKMSRNAAAFSLVTIAAVLEFDGDTIKTARVAAGSAVPFPQRLPSVEAALVGQKATTTVFQNAAAMAEKDAPWRGLEGMSQGYIKNLSRVSIVDALERANDFARRRIDK